MKDHFISEALILISFTVPRIMVIFTLLPFLSRTFFGGAMLRNGVILSLSSFLFPIVDEGYKTVELNALFYLLIIGKEIAIGAIIGWLAALPFWTLEAVGFLIDNQRGSTMASALNPLTGSQASPLGILLVQAFTTVFFVGGTFTVLVGAIYSSYVYWPVFSFFPTFIDPNETLFFYEQLDTMMRLVVVYSAPVVASMFLAEFGLGIVSRFAPQLNVFFLAMPIKSIIAMAMLTFYISILIRNFHENYFDTLTLFEDLRILWTD